MREYERLVVFFFGRLQGSRGPGIVLLIPFVQQAVKVDLRERFLEVPQQTCITKDNAPISIDFLVYSKVFQPDVTVTAVTDFTGASQALAATTLRAVIGDIPLDDVLAKREEINHILRAKLDEVTERWGVKITSVEIREIVPPRDIQDAMNRQMSAERNRRAIHHRVGGHPPGHDQRGGGRQAVEHPSRRGRAPVADPARRGLRQRAADDLRRRQAASTRRRWRSSTSTR